MFFKMIHHTNKLSNSFMSYHKLSGPRPHPLVLILKLDFQMKDTKSFLYSNAVGEVCGCSGRVWVGKVSGCRVGG